MRNSVALLLIMFIPLTISSATSKIVKEEIVSKGQKRSYYLFVPDGITLSSPAPLIVMLHGSGRNGLSLVERWQDLAAKEGIILAGPDALNSAYWGTPADGPDFLHDLVEALKAKYPINPRRVYLFGHSAGANFAIYMSLLESEYFAATAIHAGALAKEQYRFIDYAKRKAPLSIFVGTNDQFFPLATVRATRDTLNARGFAVELREISGHTHNYYGRAAEINGSAWDFLKKYQLAEEPKYEQYR